MNLGSFSVSLSVKDIKASKAFYEALGFSVFHGDIEQNWLILKNETSTIGLFQGMFEKNILTYNPGWDSNANTLNNYTDIRDIQKQLEGKGLNLVRKVEEGTSGPASITLLDPDGNPILIDQHV
ncbi:MULTISPECIES: VOC family protein [Maribacter]|uniref:VOC family protein n=1 Tax=Maribacter flavus TaxID=1658664 RepID=A0ABU7IE19_9FLAO|nr:MULTISPECIES: VOC family protein [Maribacter]MDC6403827.1 VOC family protein [Maribacter sp. PR66]MEE1970968.1 VOC family protein [Maribacter flavus]